LKFTTDQQKGVDGAKLPDLGRERILANHRNTALPSYRTTASATSHQLLATRYSAFAACRMPHAVGSLRLTATLSCRTTLQPTRQ